MRISTFHNQQGLALFYRTWLPSKESKGSLVISHGYAEHSGRYKHVAELLVERGFAVYALDHRGHGKSEGTRANIKHFGDFSADLYLLLKQVREASKNKLFLLGHSMGGAIALQTILESPELIDGLLLSAAFLQSANPPSPMFRKLLEVIVRLLPNLPIQSLDSQLLSHDPEAVQAYQNDPLVYNGKVRASLGKELLDIGPYVLEQVLNIQVPTLVMHGSDDKIASPKGSDMLFERLGTRDKTLKTYQGYYHEILNELAKEVVLEDILQWLETQINN